MKIVHLMDYYQPWMGYQETYLCLEQARLGHDVWIVTSDRFAPRTEKLINNRFLTPGITKEQGVNIWRLPLYFELHTTNGYVCLKGLKNALGSIHPDMIHCHGIISITSLFAACYKRRIHYSLVYDNHTSLLNLFNFGEGSIKKAFKIVSYQIFAAFVNFTVIPKADSVVAIGEEEEEFLHWLFHGKLSKFPIIHLGADHRHFTKDLEARSQYRDSYKWDPQDLVLGHAGKIQPSKGIENLIRALALIRDCKTRIRLFLIGSIDEEYRKNLMAVSFSLNLSESIFFHPFASREELPKLLNTFDIAVWPGDITNTAIESMAVGLPIVTCRTNYTEAIIEKYSAGILVERNDVKGLAMALRLLIENDDTRYLSGKNARKAVETELNWESISKQFVDLYIDCIKHEC